MGGRKHGTYRPNLAKLVASNSVKDIRDTTKEAFETFSANDKDYAKSITTLSKLKGVGPATASLFLSCYDPAQVPFFSDELYRYVHWEETKEKGWDRKISYTAKSYREMYYKVQEMRERLEKASKKETGAIEVEKVAYVLAKDSENSAAVLNGWEDEADNKALQPPSPKRRKTTAHSQRRRHNEVEESEDPITICFNKGPNGSPTHDKLGFELDYHKVAPSMRARKPNFKKQEKHLKEAAEDDKRKGEIMGVGGMNGGKGPGGLAVPAMTDRVARDLGMPYHKVGVEHFEEWKSKGFKVKKNEFENLSKEELERVDEQMTGSVFRK